MRLKHSLVLSALALTVSSGLAFTQTGTDAGKKEAAKEPAKETKSAAKEGAADKRYVLGHTMKSIDGKDVNLADYKGKVLVLVNVASKCGYTKQYDGLEQVYKDKSVKGLVVLGFPANNFGGQEPGSNEEIAKFCKDKYSVTFPMFSKISVKGSDQHALFKQLASQAAPVGGDPKWNFTKFLVDREGNVVARYDSSTAPSDKEFVAKIDELLAAGAKGDKDKPATDKPATDAKPGK